MKLYKASDRGKIYTRIFIYEKRRQELREKWGVINGGKAPEEYNKAARKMNNKLATWRKQITMIDRRNIQIIAIANQVAYFSGINVKLSIENIDERCRQARNIFYKYCLENSIPATLVAEYVGASRGDTVARGRMNFTKSFEKNPRNREIYHRFIDYMKDVAENIKSGENEKY